MKQYKAYIISYEQLKKWNISTNIAFRNGFLIDSNSKSCIWNSIQEHLKEPIVSIRPSGRTSWNELLVFCANGYVREDGIHVLQYNSVEEYKTVLQDIFSEFSVDELEVTEWYEYQCSEEIKEEILKWIKETF